MKLKWVETMLVLMLLSRRRSAAPAASTWVPPEGEEPELEPYTPTPGPFPRGKRVPPKPQRLQG